MKKMTLTIGIPAHNEAHNIAQLIFGIKKQHFHTITLGKCIIISDGSTDTTVLSARSAGDKRFKIIEHTKCKGKAIRQQELLRIANTDLFILLDADIVLEDPEFIEKLVAPLRAGKADMTSAAIREVAPRTFFESILQVSMKVKTVLFETFKAGDNVYTCHGPARAFTKKVYKKLRFMVSDGEDIHSFLQCKTLGYRYTFVKAAVLFYRLPTTFADHAKQSLRYIGAQEDLSVYFDKDLIRKELTFPMSDLVTAAFKSIPIILRYPMHTFLYLGILGYIKLLSLLRIKPRQMWEVQTSKVVL